MEYSLVHHGQLANRVRLSKGMSVDELAQKMNLSGSRIYGLLKQAYIRPDGMASLAKALDVDVNEFLPVAQKAMVAETEALAKDLDRTLDKVLAENLELKDENKELRRQVLKLSQTTTSLFELLGKHKESNPLAIA